MIKKSRINRNFVREAGPYYHFVHRKFHISNLGLNSDPLGQRQVVNRPSHVTDIKFVAINAKQPFFGTAFN